MTSKVLGLFFFVLLSTVGVASLYSTAQSPKVTKDAPPQEKIPQFDSHLFDNIVERIKTEYVEETTDEKLLEGALNGMLSALDPHSAYLNPKSYEELKMRTKAEYGGLGMEVTMENGLVKIISPIDDTPAQKAGLQAGDLIVTVDKQPITGKTLNEAVDLLRGKAGTPVRLYIKREGHDVFEKILMREIIHVKSVKWRTEEDVGYIRITTFDESTTSLLKEAIAEIKKKLGSSLQGLVLDVRNDPGGLLDVAINTSNLFLTKGEEIVSTRGRNPKIDERFYADGADITNGIPIVVLVNQGSASASEILAGALQDNHRALVVGTKSFGKGSVQVVMPLTNGGAITLTTARYYTPSGRSIQAKGIKPDIVIKQVQNKLETLDESIFPHEQDFSRALDTDQENKTLPLSDKKESNTQNTLEEVKKFEAEKEKKKKEIEDYQLMRAIDIVRTMAITQNYDKKNKK